MQHQKIVEIYRRKKIYISYLFVRRFYNFFAWIHFFKELKYRVQSLVTWPLHCLHKKFATIWLYGYALIQWNDYVYMWPSTIAWPGQTGFTGEFICVPRPRYSGRSQRNVKYNIEQGNRADMRKIPQFFGASGLQGHFFEKTKKKTFSDKVYGSMFTKFQVCIVFRFSELKPILSFKMLFFFIEKCIDCRYFGDSVFKASERNGVR